MKTKGGAAKRLTEPVSVGSWTRHRYSSIVRVPGESFPTLSGVSVGPWIARTSEGPWIIGSTGNSDDDSVS